MDYGLALRIVLGWAALLMAGAQFSMRYILAQNETSAVRRKEFSGALAGGILLIGVGIGNLTHIHAPASISTVIISLGVILSAWALETVWRATNGGT